MFQGDPLSLLHKLRIFACAPCSRSSTHKSGNNWGKWLTDHAGNEGGPLPLSLWRLECFKITHWYRSVRMYLILLALRKLAISRDVNCELLSDNNWSG